MPDEFDRAAALEQQQRQQALDAQRGRGNFDRPSLEDCEDCGLAIPEARRRFGGVTRCVGCQETAEKTEQRQ